GGGAVRVGGGGGGEGVEGVEGLRDERRRGLGAGEEEGGGEGRDVARQHRGAADVGGRHAGGAGDGVGEDAFERALPQLAEQQADQKILFVRRGAAEETAQRFGSRTRRSGAARRREALE